MKVFLSVFLAFLMLTMAASAAPLPDTDSIPPSLEPWKPWVLHGEEERFCPTSYNDGEVYRCLWPSVLDLDIDRRGGRFTQQWVVFVKGWVPLPGGQKQWPLNVKVDEKSVPVVGNGGVPSVYMTPGKHRVEGTFVWNDMPEMIRIPNASGLVNLSIENNVVNFPLLDSDGRLWLQKRKETAAQEERMEVGVFRLVKDSIPMRATTHLKINISGRAREISLDGILLDNFIPLSIESPIPARLGATGNLIVQARPGRWEIRVLARSDGPVKAIKSLNNRYGEEIWAFQSQNYLRMVKVEDVPSIDPNQTDIPSEWRKFPAYIVNTGDQMAFKEIRRGDPDPAPDQIHLKRTWWLDFDGRGFTIQDRITGTMSRQWYLAMNPPAILGRVSVDGRDQLITSQGKDKKPGVELRKGRLNLVSESRFEASTGDIPAVGWDHDFQSVSGFLNLPPGWRLLTASGVDVMPGNWFSRWTLLDLFLVLIISLSVYKLWNWKWGVLALVAVGLTYHEPGSPRIVWLHLLAATALLRFLPQGWMRKLANIWCLISFVTLVVLAIPFMVDQVRWGIYPQLEVHMSGPGPGVTKKTAEPQYLEEKDKRPPSPMKGYRESRMDSFLGQSRLADKTAPSRKQALMIQDPNALIQTGPGLPNWKWRSYSMKWNGPVESLQKVRLWMLSPSINLVLAFVRVVLLALLIYRMIGFRQWKMPEGSFTFAAVFMSMMLVPSATAGESTGNGYPSKEILDQLKERLLEKPDCLPSCAESPQMKLTVSPDSLRILLKIHAAVETAVPLPGSLELWRPAQVLLDGNRAAGLMRDNDGSMWILVPKGIHTATLIGSTPAGNSFQILLPLKPQKVIVESDGWDVQGVSGEGRVEGGIKLIRQQREIEDYSIQPARTLPPFLHIERVLSLGLNWQVWTRVERLTPVGTPVVVSVPLIAGESVTTAGVSVEDGNVQVNMGPGIREIKWNSTLKTENVIKLRAPESVLWTETWLLDASPIWHCEVAGIPVVHHQDQSGQWRPQWKPWPGEEVLISVSRPKAIAGQSVTIDSAKLALTPGERFDKADLSLKIRSSQGGQHKIILPKGAKLQQVKISGKTQPIREQGRDLIVPLRPGSQNVDVEWHQGAASSIMTRAPKVRIGEQAVNADVTFQMPRNRWILWTKGPRLGPAVLFWSYLIVVIIAAIALGRVTWTPLKTPHWIFLGLGLTQVHPLVAIMIVGWFLVLGLREKYPFPAGWFSFNLSQIILVVWTAAALVGLYVAIQKGLLGIPNMQISGNGSSDFLLRWTQDRIGAFMPAPLLFSLPLFLFRILMLVWALWLAYSLLKWLRWGWKCFGEGGLWRKVAFRSRNKEPQPTNASATGKSG